jgi:hypothetical protein
MLPSTDLFNFPVDTPPRVTELRPPRDPMRKYRDAVRQAARRIEQSNTPFLFGEDAAASLLEALMQPLLDAQLVGLPMVEYQTLGLIDDAPAPEQVDDLALLMCAIDPRSSGDPWVVSHEQCPWHRDEITLIQCKLYHQSLLELTLSDNENEKWDVLKWIFAPAVTKRYIYDERIGRSHCLTLHEYDHPFSFRNCCIAARRDEDEWRDIVRANIGPSIFEAICKIVKY